MKGEVNRAVNNKMECDPVPEKLTNGCSTEGDVKQDSDYLTLEDIREQIRYIEKSAKTKEIHYMARALRSLPVIRRKLNHKVLLELVQCYFPNPSPQKTYFIEFLPEAMETDCIPPKVRLRTVKPTTSQCPEVEIYLHLLLLVFLIDAGHYEKAKRCSNVLMDRINLIPRRSMDILTSRCYYYHSRIYDLSGCLEAVRPFFHSQLCTATLKSNHYSQAVLINLILYNYLYYQLFDQADKLNSKVVFPSDAPNNELARYLYYQGLIKAIQLDYTSAHSHLVTALRKAPQNTAVGFKQTLHKLNTVVELLLGEQPARSTFRHPSFKTALQPYFQLTQAIHAGDLGRFNEVLRAHGAQFIADKTYTLIIRLHHNVIKTGVRRISSSYSRIPLASIAEKLQLDSPKDAEYVVAKAIRDGVIDASIDHEKGYVTTNETMDLYSTREPFNQFNERIQFCLRVHNQAVKAMRYPPKQHDKDMESARERREREQQELETAKEFSDEDFDGYP